MPGGATTPRQLVTSTSMPLSFSVGMSFIWSIRSALATAIGRSFPASICGLNSETLETPTVSGRDNSVAIASPPPEWAM